jgi:hypothetical protein
MLAPRNSGWRGGQGGSSASLTSAMVLPPIFSATHRAGTAGFVGGFVHPNRPSERPRQLMSGGICRVQPKATVHQIDGMRPAAWSPSSSIVRRAVGQRLPLQQPPIGYTTAAQRSPLLVAGPACGGTNSRATNRSPDHRVELARPKNATAAHNSDAASPFLPFAFSFSAILTGFVADTNPP